MDWLTHAWDVAIHVDHHLNAWSGSMGLWFYAVIALIVFCETGLVVMPFLPGDSLLFVLGLLSRTEESPIHPGFAAVVLTIATLAGDNTNYWLGRSLGPRVFSSTTSRLLNRAYLLRAQQFYEKHGPRTIVLARFIAVIRTFAPFVAGIGRMDYRRFLSYSVGGAVLWVWGLIFLGWSLGEVPGILDHTSAIMWAIMSLTLVLGLTEAVKARRRRKETDARVTDAS